MTEAAAVLLRDGRLVAAAEEERFSRVKHAGGFPYAAIDACLASEGIGLADVDHVAVYWNPYNVFHRTRLMMSKCVTNPAMGAEFLRRARTVVVGRNERDSGWVSLFRTRRNLGRKFGVRVPRIHFLDHHACHMASSFFGSGFEESALLVFDGAGEAACTSCGIGSGTSIDTLDQHLLPHSLGHFYSAVTGWLGFEMLDGEYKVMGLSPYGDPSGARWIRDNFLRTTMPGRYALEPGVLDYIPALRGNFDGAFVRYFGGARTAEEVDEVSDRHRDVAASAQKAFEEVVLDLAENLRRRTGLRRLSIAGGCGLNCVANGRILTEGIFDTVYVPPVPGDAGGALGAAMLLHARLTKTRPEPIMHAQYGPRFDDSSLRAVLRGQHQLECEYLPEAELCNKTAGVLAAGAVVAWMQGRMEYGPRALGSRSFLADPRYDQARELMNEKIKKREPFRPFAPSVKAERAAEFFELRQPSPFMTLVVPVRPEKRSIIPAVTHVNGTARPQTVDRAHLPLYWQLLDAFERRTGVPVLLNTSFNIQEPIVCTPSEALSTFARSGADALVLGNYFVTRRAAL